VERRIGVCSDEEMDVRDDRIIYITESEVYFQEHLNLCSENVKRAESRVIVLKDHGNLFPKNSCVNIILLIQQRMVQTNADRGKKGLVTAYRQPVQM